MDGARLELVFNASHTFQSLALICDSPSGCDLTTSLQFYNAWGRVPFDEPRVFAIAQLGLQLEQDRSNQYMISVTGDLTDPDATRSYFFASGSDTTARSLPDGTLELKKTMPNGRETINIGRGGPDVDEFTVEVGASWAPRGN